MRTAVGSFIMYTAAVEKHAITARAALISTHIPRSFYASRVTVFRYRHVARAAWCNASAITDVARRAVAELTVCPVSPTSHPATA
jgi:hypothetical protein